MKKVKFLLSVSWRPALWWVIISSLFAALLLYKLGTLVPGAAEAEVKTVSHLVNRDLSLLAILKDPAYLPYYLNIYVFEKLHIASIFSGRFISTTIGALAIFSFYYLLSRWHTPRIAFLSTLMFASSSWFLHGVRLATTDSTYLLVLPLLACGAWLHDTRKNGGLPLLGGVALTGLLLYTPGLIWFSLAGVFWQRGRVRHSLASLTNWKMLAGVVGFFVLVAPLIFAVQNKPQVIFKLLGLPESVPSGADVISRLASIPKQLFVSGTDNPVYWVGNMPLLDALTITCFALGFIFLYGKFSLDRTRILIFGLILGVTLYCLGIAPLVVLLPFVYLAVANGITYLLTEWYGTFPRNPIARSLGTALLTIAIATSVFYNISHYFVAWANAPETRKTFSRKL